ERATFRALAANSKTLARQAEKTLTDTAMPIAAKLQAISQAQTDSANLLQIQEATARAVRIKNAERLKTTLPAALEAVAEAARRELEQVRQRDAEQEEALAIVHPSSAITAQLPTESAITRRL